MADPSESDERETYTARLSFRSTAKNLEKLVAIARAKKWINAKGKPNVSAVLNYLIDTFDLGALPERKKKEKSNGR